MIRVPSFERLLCSWGFHQLVVIHRISGSAQHIGCTSCKKEFGINHDVQAVVPWAEVSALYTDEIVPGVVLYKPDPADVARRLNPNNYVKKVRHAR